MKLFRWIYKSGAVRILLACTVLVYAQPHSSNLGGVQETKMMKHAHGAFDVKLNPQKPDNKEEEAARIGRMSIDKQFHGDLEGTSKGEMLYNTSEVKESGAYVAIERVTGTINGRSGTFDLHHLGIKDRGKQQLTISVIPDSGTGQLQGIAGQMNITITDGKHFYDFEYELPEASK
jgi:Protein of unknown function (DUF3224)